MSASLIFCCTCGADDAIADCACAPDDRDWHSWPTPASAAAAPEAVTVAPPDPAAAKPALSAEMAAVAKLATLDPIARARARKVLAQRFAVGVKAIDDAFESLKSDAAAPPSLAPPPPTPASEAVAPAVLLDDLRAFIARFVIVDDHALTAITLWCAFAHAFEAAETSPRLALLSPTKRCGKTRALALLAMLTPKAIAASNLTPAAIFRTIEAERPTLLIDECDTIARDNPELRGILNSGHDPESAFVIRAVPDGDAWVPRRFSTFAPIAMAGIGKLPETWLDRSIVISMRRKLRAESVERLTRANKPARAQAATLAAQLARLAADHLAALGTANPAPANLESDRAIDNWCPLLAIADLAGDEWAARARAAAVALSGGRDAADDDSLGIKLLADIREILRDILASEPADRIASSVLVERLNGLELSPWSTISRGRPLTANRLARMLAGFSVYVTNFGAFRGYRKADFDDPITRYLRIPPAESVKASQPQRAVGGNDDFKASLETSDDGSKMCNSPYGENNLCRYDGLKGGIGGNICPEPPETGAIDLLPNPAADPDCEGF